MSTRVLVTGGAGFIGSNFVRHVVSAHPQWEVVVLDKLTYAGRRENLADVERHPGFSFVQGDIADAEVVTGVLPGCRYVVNFAAETHVDRSLYDAGSFIQTDVFGTFVLLEAARRSEGMELFVQISTDEVYGSVEQGSSRETDALMPRNPYSASKAGADRLAYSYFATYGLPVIVTRASNNYGPYQFPEKVIPLFVTHALDHVPLPLYGDGLNVRDWLHVDDHCRAVDFLLERGRPGEAYNVGGGNEVANIDLTHRILSLVGRPESLIRRVPDRPGHDRRYSLDCSKLRGLGWQPQVPFAEGLAATVAWYREHEPWWRPLKEADPAFREHYQRHYRET
ncbi:MAG TPA: dTDP-glucose 4,6-dehydratase [Vicinamibacteria bacterium]|nr:dTDP-glucose 4,6-dehydratase [Vicinamibacteria bacterium]